MKRLLKLTTFSLVGGLVLFTSMPAAFAQASTGESEATINFKVESAPPVLDPTEPTKPYEPNPDDPTDPQDDPTGETGPLTLDYVSSVHFGEQEITGTSEVYEATVLRPFIQVSDRRGTGAGWTVTAQASEFTDADDETAAHTLKGAKLTFTNGEAVSPNETLATPNPSPSVELNTGGDAATVVTAGTGEGMATWITRWLPSQDANPELNDNVTLEIPAGTASPGSHAATITWTLTDGPGQ